MLTKAAAQGGKRTRALFTESDGERFQIIQHETLPFCNRAFCGAHSHYLVGHKMLIADGIDFFIAFNDANIYVAVEQRLHNSISVAVEETDADIRIILMKFRKHFWNDIKRYRGAGSQS